LNGFIYDDFNTPRANDITDEVVLSTIIDAKFAKMQIQNGYSDYGRDYVFA
jgi:hypothetical protein